MLQAELLNRFVKGTITKRLNSAGVTTTKRRVNELTQLVRNDVIARAAQTLILFDPRVVPFLLFLIATLGYFAETGTELRVNLLP